LNGEMQKIKVILFDWLNIKINEKN
jgi:hypothetical protein